MTTADYLNCSRWVGYVKGYVEDIVVHIEGSDIMGGDGDLVSLEERLRDLSTGIINETYFILEKADPVAKACVPWGEEMAESGEYGPTIQDP